MEDNKLRQLMHQIVEGWPDTIKDVNTDIREYWDYRDELTVENGLILKGCRAIIPTKLRRYYMEKLHTGHMGITKTQLRARDTIYYILQRYYILYSRINCDIKNTVRVE